MADEKTEARSASPAPWDLAPRARLCGPGGRARCRAWPGGGGRHPNPPPRLIWQLVFTLGSRPRFFYFLKPRTCSTFIIKTHKTRNLCTALQPGVGGCWPGSSWATRGSRQPPVGPCRSPCPISSSARWGEHFPTLPAVKGRRAPAATRPSVGPSGFMVLLCTPCWCPGPQEPRSSGGASGPDTSRMRTASGCTWPPQNSDPRGAAQLPGSQNAEVRCCSAWF